MRSDFCSILAVICLFGSALAPTSVAAWGASGHRMVSRLAMENLPAELPRFLRRERARFQVGELGREPDRSKGSGQPHDRDLDPGHFINLDDDFQVRGGLPLEPLPANREEYDNALRALGSNEYRAGYLPYSIIDGWQQLQKDFAYWRADVAAARHARSARARAWFVRDRRLREMIILRDLGYWSHFVADASQPMHVSIHYDGWGDYPNPRELPNQRGFHAAFEGEFIARQVTSADVKRLLPPRRDCDCTIQARTVDYLRQTHAEIIPLYQLARDGQFAAGNLAARDFAAGRIAAAVAELRDLIVDAWRGSADSVVGYPALKVRDIEAGTVNPLPEMMGRD